MLTQYGIHKAQDVAIAAHDLRHALRELSASAAPDSAEEQRLDHAAELADIVARIADANWHAVRLATED